MQQTQRPARPGEVLGEVPAFHPLHAGQGVQRGAQLLLHLQAHSPPRRSVPEAEGDGGWQRHSGTACPGRYPEGEDPGRRRGCPRAEERGAELGHAGQQPLHLRQPPPAPPGAAGAVSRPPPPRGLDGPRLWRMLGTPPVSWGAPWGGLRKGFVSIRGPRGARSPSPGATLATPALAGD